MEAGYLIGVDIGTYSSKGVVTRMNGEVVASYTLPHTMEMPQPGHFEHDADKVWWHDFVEIVQNLLHQSGISPNEIKGIGTSAIGSCVLPIDENGNPLRPGILYGIDTRATEEIRFLENRLGKDTIFDISGANLTSQASGPKILWIRNHEPEVYAKTRWFLTSQAYLVFKLTGKASIDIYTAAGYAPMFNVQKIQWDKETTEIITSLDRLPALYWSHEIVGTVTEEAARETGLAVGTPVVAGTTDAAAESLSVGVADPGDMMLMFGSSLFFILKTAEWVRTERFWSARFLEEGAYAFLGGMSTSGSLTTWFRDQFATIELEHEKDGGENAFTALAHLAEKSPLGANGLILLPYFEGERTPIHDPKAKGVLFGLSLKNTKGDIYRAILEGVAYGFYHNLQEMLAEGVIPKRIIAVGGGTKNPLWLQIVADVCNINLVVPEQQIGASYGDAFLAGTGIGLFENLSEIKQWVKPKFTIEANGLSHQSYKGYYQIYRSLYQDTKPLMHDLDDMLKGQKIPANQPNSTGT